MLTSNGDIVRGRKEYFNDLNPTDMPSLEEVKSEASEEDPPLELRSLN